MRRFPPASRSTSTEVAPASSAFSSSSLTTAAGRSTTSPAAIWLARWSGRMRIFAKAVSVVLSRGSLTSSGCQARGAGDSIQVAERLQPPTGVRVENVAFVGRRRCRQRSAKLAEPSNALFQAPPQLLDDLGPLLRRCSASPPGRSRGRRAESGRSRNRGSASSDPSSRRSAGAGACSAPPRRARRPLPPPAGPSPSRPAEIPGSGLPGSSATGRPVARSANPACRLPRRPAA